MGYIKNLNFAQSLLVADKTENIQTNHIYTTCILQLKRCQMDFNIMNKAVAKAKKKSMLHRKDKQRKISLKNKIKPQTVNCVTCNLYKHTVRLVKIENTGAKESQEK